MPAQVKSTSVAFSWVCTWVKVLGVKLGALHAQVRLSFQDHWSGCFGNSVKWDTKCLLTIFALWLGEIENAVGNLVTQPWWCEFDHWGCAASDKRRMNWHCVNKSGCSSSLRAGAHVPGYIQRRLCLYMPGPCHSAGGFLFWQLCPWNACAFMDCCLQLWKAS